jgi:hypothetical protein
MAKDVVLYVCKNPACTLGTVGQLGRFTGGITAEQKHLLTGAPVETFKEGVDYGEGVCTNCGQPGETYDVAKATATAVAEAKERHAAELAAIKEGVA